MQQSELDIKLQKANLKIASLKKRIISMSIDDLLISFLIFIAFIDEFSKAKTFQQMLILTDRLFLYIFIAYTLYHWIFIAIYGKTIGKMIMKIKCIDIQTLDKPDFFRSLIRSIFRNFDEMFFYAGMIVAIFDPYNRALHDIIGRCVVVEDN